MAEAQAVPGIEGVEISVALHHTVTPLPEGESYLGFIFAGGETPAAVEAALRAAHAKLRFTIVPEIGLLSKARAGSCGVLFCPARSNAAGGTAPARGPIRARGDGQA